MKVEKALLVPVTKEFTSNKGEGYLTISNRTVFIKGICNVARRKKEGRFFRDVSLKPNK